MQSDDCTSNSCAKAGNLADYRKGIKDLLASCTDVRNGTQVADGIREGRKLLAEHGVHKTELEILQGVDWTIPAGKRVKCADQISTYVAMLEPVTPPSASPSRTAG